MSGPNQLHLQGLLCSLNNSRSAKKALPYEDMRRIEYLIWHAWTVLGCPSTEPGCPTSTEKSLIYSRSYETVTTKHFKTISAPRQGKESTYGELTTDGCLALFQFLEMDHTHVFIDLGSGIGNVVLQAALYSRTKRSIGIEKDRVRSSFAVELRQQAYLRCQFWHTALPDIRLHNLSFLDLDPASLNDLSEADFILVCNEVFEPKRTSVRRKSFPLRF